MPHAFHPIVHLHSYSADSGVYRRDCVKRCFAAVKTNQALFFVLKIVAKPVKLMDVLNVN